MAGLAARWASLALLLALQVAAAQPAPAAEGLPVAVQTATATDPGVIRVVNGMHKKWGASTPGPRETFTCTQLPTTLRRCLSFAGKFVTEDCYEYLFTGWNG